VLNVSVISPEASVFEGTTDSVVAPGHDGEFGLLSDHAPMMTLLGKGVLRIGTGAAVKSFAIEGGFLQVAGNAVRVVTEKATPA
jgi:F-type H+-transporting ATPase subunit epsilon